MKNLILILLCLGLTGCISSSVVRGIDKNTYYSSSSPNIQIQVPSHYSYKKGARGYMDHHFQDGENYVFINFIPHMANETQIDYYYNPETWIFNHVPNSIRINQGTKNILGETWYFCNSVPSEGRYRLIHDLRHFSPRHNLLSIRFATSITKDDYDLLKDHEYITERHLKALSRLLKPLDEVVISNYNPDTDKTESPLDAKLKLLREAYDSGLITQDEYLTKKHELLKAL